MTTCATPEMIAAAWRAWHARHGGKLGPGPAFAEAIEAAIEAQKTRDIAEFQERVSAWCVTCFGETTAYDVVERNWRFLEEALELVQALGGNADDAHELVDYVFRREAGDPPQEVGGTMVTLAASVAANGLSIVDAAFAELERIERPEIIENIRRKHASKPRRSPLPGDYRHAREP